MKDLQAGGLRQGQRARHGTRWLGEDSAQCVRTRSVVESAIGAGFATYCGQQRFSPVAARRP